MGAYGNKVTRFFLGLFLISFGFGGLTTGFLFPVDSFAAVFEVSTSAQLQNALTTAQNNGEDDTINIAEGTFFTSGRTFTYVAAERENSSLTLAGAGLEKTDLTGVNTSTRVLMIDTFSNLSDDSNVNIVIKSLTVDNGSDKFGGGLFLCTGSARVSIEHNRFIHNFAEFAGNAVGGGAEIDTVSGSVRLIDNLFVDNRISSRSLSASGGGADIFSESGSVTLERNIFNGNMASSASSPSGLFFTAGGGVSINTGGDIELINNLFQSNQAFSSQGSASGGAVDIETSGNITLTANRFLGNFVTASAGGSSQFVEGSGVNAFTASGRVTLTNNLFAENSASVNSSTDSADVSGAGAEISTASGAIELKSNSFNHNSATSGDDPIGSAAGGGAIVFSASGTIALVNNQFLNNSTFSLFDSFGGGAVVATTSGVINFTNNTLISNLTTDNGGGLDAISSGDTSVINIYNNIIFFNEAMTGAGNKKDDIFVNGDRDENGTSSEVKLFNNDFSVCVSSTPATPACADAPNIMKGANINQDPLLMLDPSGRNVHLQSGSPIDKGTSSAPALPVTDFEGDPRIVGSAPDIGADEFAAPPGLVNNLVTFKRIKSTFKAIPDTIGCPSGFDSKFSFSARLTNTSNSSLFRLIVQVTTLTNDNLLQNADGEPGGVGARLTVPNEDGFSDGVLSPNESVDVQFVICLKTKERFSFFVDVLGIVQ